MSTQFFKNPLFRSKFLHYFLIITSLVFLFTLGPRILVEQLTNSNPNTAIAQDCGQQPCPSVPVPPPPPEECTTSCPGGKTGTCGGHKYWDQAAGAFGDCMCETENATCTNPAPPPPACTPDEVIGTTQHCVGNQMCTFNIHHRADCSTYEGGAFGCQNSAACGFVNPPPPPSSVCVGTPCDRPVGESTCRDGRKIFCKQDGPECGGVGCNCMVDTGSTCNTGGSNPPPPPPPPAPPPPAPPAQGGNSSSASNSSSNSTSNSSSNSNSASNANASANQNQTQSQAQTTSISNTNSNTNNNNLTQSVNLGGTNFIWATPSPTATVIPTPTATTTSTTTVIIGQGGGGQTVGKTQVQGIVQELPNTGSPLVVIALLGFVPIGWKMRKYAFKTLDPSSIWNDRELKK